MLKRFSPWAWALPGLLGALLLAVGWPLASDHDLYLHLKTGELTIERGLPGLNDRFSYTDPSAPEETHSWLSQVVLYETYHWGGETGLRALNTLLLFFLVGLCFRFVWRRGNSAAAAGLTAAFVVLAQAQVQTFRPVVISQALGAVLLFAILAPETPWTKKRGLAAVLLTALWANLHGSSLLAPLFVFLRTRRFGWTMACAAALLVNPRGPELWIDSLAIVDLGRSLAIGEWVSNVYPPILWIAAAGALWTLLKRGRNDWTAVTGAILVCLAFSAHRHLAWLFFPLCAAGAALASGVTLRASPALLGIAIALWGGRFWVSGLTTMPVERAVNFLQAAGLEGNVFNHPSWGAYLAFRLYPKIKVAHTMRLLTHKNIFLWEKERWFSQGGMTLDEVTQQWPETQIAFLPSSWPIPHLADPTQWAPIYVNNQAVILLRRTPANTENWKKAQSYYANRKLPFEEGPGLLPRLVDEIDPAWMRAQEEKGGWGRWPDPEKLSRAYNDSINTWKRWLSWKGESSPGAPERFYWKPSPPPQGTAQP